MEEVKQTSSVELDLQREDHQFQLQMQQQQHNHENELKNKEIGWLGKFFGTEENSARNMAITVIVLVVLGATIFSICVLFNPILDNVFIKDVWGDIVPIVSLALGYIFGKNKG